jgi:hypothetical protein
MVLSNVQAHYIPSIDSPSDDATSKNQATIAEEQGYGNWLVGTAKGVLMYVKDILEEVGNDQHDLPYESL